MDSSGLGEEFKPAVAKPVLLCFSHLRWSFVHQRPQHLLTLAAADFRVIYIEEPEPGQDPPHFRMRTTQEGVTILTPVFGPHNDRIQEQRTLIDGLVRSLQPCRLVLWYYTPMALPLTRDLTSDLCVYDCMDELSAFRFAPAELATLETELLARADLVFTGGKSLSEAKCGRHHSVHCFPSGVDVLHFGQARSALADPADQAAIPHPRIGYFGVIDERIDFDLIAAAAREVPEVQFVYLGPIAKIDPASLPQAANLHWLGCKQYHDLPDYTANWDAAWMPFALNEATRYISPTKTPEYLAAGLPVVTTAIADVVTAYGATGVVRVTSAATLAADLRASLTEPSADWLRKVDVLLKPMSWSATWDAMNDLIAARARVVEGVEYV